MEFYAVWQALTLLLKSIGLEMETTVHLEEFLAQPYLFCNRIVQVAQQNHEENSARVQAWQSKVDSAFRACYSVSAELVNGARENLRCYRKFAEALDLHC